jgi:putative ABC transport system substrate-binding protein
MLSFAPALRLVRAIRETIHSVPIVGVSADMVASGFVRSLARPGGNITGVSFLSPELNGKRQEILMEAVPGARRIAALEELNNSQPAELQALQNAARSRNLEVRSLQSERPNKSRQR